MKKYYGVLIALIPFITGSYQSLNDWSTSEIVGYNIFNLALIGFGIYYFVKNHSINKNIDFTEYDIAIFRASKYLNKFTKENKESDYITRSVFVDELNNLINLFKKRRNEKWRDQIEVDKKVSELNDLLDKETVNFLEDMKI